MPVVRNPQFYFKEGFCWTDVNSTYLKARLKKNGVFDVLSMSLFTLYQKLPDWYYVCLVNSRFISQYVDNFINNTSHFQINDARQLPIIHPKPSELEEFKDLFNRAMSVKNNLFNNDSTSSDYDKKLSEIQIELDQKVISLYQIV